VTSDQGNGNTITGLLLAHQIVQLCLTAIYFYEFFVFQGVMSRFRVVVCDWSRCGVLLRRAGYDIKAPWGNTSWRYRIVVWGRDQGEEVGGWGKGMRIKGEKMKETVSKRGRKMKANMTENKEFDKRYGKKKKW